MRTPALALLLVACLPAVAAQPICWTGDSLQRVGRTDPPGATVDAAISAARGEVESFQVVVRGPSGGLTRVGLALSDLVGPGGAVIPATRYTRYREHYVQVSPGSPDWGG